MSTDFWLISLTSKILPLKTPMGQKIMENLTKYTVTLTRQENNDAEDDDKEDDHECELRLFILGRRNFAIFRWIVMLMRMIMMMIDDFEND